VVRHIRYLTLLSSSLVLFFFASGQDDEQINHNYTFSVYAFKKIQGLYYDTYTEDSIRQREYLKRVSIPLRFYTVSRSPTYNYRGPDPIVFYRWEYDISEPSKNIKIPVGSISLSYIKRNLLFIFLQDAKSQFENPKFKIQTFNDSSSHLKMNKLIVYNLSGRLLEGHIGEESVRIGAGPTSPFSASNSLPVTLWYNINGNAVPGFNLSLTLKRNHRYLLFFFPPSIEGAIELQYRILDEEVEVPRELIFEDF
jgi:hypothetical protein